MRLAFILLLLWSGPVAVLAGSAGLAAEVTDATGRTVTIPDHVGRVLPAGPPAAVLLAALGAGQMLGLPFPLGAAARDALAAEVAGLPTVPRLTGPADNTAAIEALHPDLIIDYGNVSPRYRQLAEETQRKTGIPTLLFDGALEQVPSVARTVGAILHQPERAEAVARVAEAVLALAGPPGSHRRVYYARGADGLLSAAAGTDVTAVFTRIGWEVVSPEGAGTFRPATVEAIERLDPDVIIVSDPAAGAVLQSAAWRGLRAVREGHAWLAPSVPFGWVEEPPSINRLLGLAWLSGADPVTLAALFNAGVYGRVLGRDAVLAIAGGTPAVGARLVGALSDGGGPDGAGAGGSVPGGAGPVASGPLSTGPLGNGPLSTGAVGAGLRRGGTNP